MKFSLNKYLSMCGVASRRKAESIIESNKVSINGKIAKLTDKVDDEIDVVTIKGKVIKPFTHEYYILNKPKNVVSTTSDDKNRPTVVDYVKSKVKLNVVGRLDFDTTGLVLLTNDGDLIYKITHPKSHVAKTYLLTVSGTVTADQVNRLKQGVNIGGYKTQKAKIENIQTIEDKTTFEITIFEGKNQQIKRMCEAAGLHFLYLERLAIGDLTLQGLKSGHSKQFTKEEIYKFF
ncbi:MAG: pseudouridine synthase [bacterium]|nr:pseudouridine synthase [bacterium]